MQHPFFEVGSCDDGGVREDEFSEEVHFALSVCLDGAMVSHVVITEGGDGGGFERESVESVSFESDTAGFEYEVRRTFLVCFMELFEEDEGSFCGESILFGFWYFLWFWRESVKEFGVRFSSVIESEGTAVGGGMFEYFEYLCDEEGA